MSKILTSMRDQVKNNLYVTAGILFVNFIGFYIVFRWTFLLVLLIIDTIFITISLLPQITSFLRRKRTSQKNQTTFSQLFTQMIGLIIHQYKINRRYILASVFGLILAILVVSQTYLLNSTYNQSSFDRYVNFVQPAAYEVTLSGIEDNQQRLGWLDKVDKELPELLKEEGISVRSQYTFAQVTASIIVGEEVSEQANIRFVNTFQFNTWEWTKERYDFYSPFPTFPKNYTFDPTENFLIIPPSLKFGTNSYTIDDFIVDGNVSILADRPVSDTLAPAEFLNLSYSIDNYWQPQQEDLLYLYNNNMDAQKKLLHKALYLPKGEGWNLFLRWSKIMNDNPRIALNIYTSLQMKTLVYTDIPFFDDIELQRYQASLIHTRGPIQSWGNLWTALKNKDGTNLLVSVYSPLDKAIRNYQDSIGALQEFLILITSPLIAIALYLVNFALNMVQKRRDNIVSVMKTRGTAKNQLYLMFSAEIILGGLVASVIGMILSIPWTALSLRTNGFFKYSSTASLDLVVSNSWYVYLPLLGFLIGFNIHVMSILSVSKISTDEEVNKRTRSIKPLWQEMYLDVILFVLAIIYWITLSNIQIGREQVVEFLIYDVGPYILAILMIASPSVFQRFYYPVVALLTRILTIKNRGDLIYLTKKNVYLHRFSTSKLAALLSAGFILTILTISVPSSFNHWAVESASYEHGAEIRIEGLSVELNDRFGYLDIPEVAVVSPFVKTDFNFLSPYKPDFGELIDEYTFMGIDTDTFGEVAYWNDYYSSYSLDEIVQSLEKDRTIGLSEKTLDALGLEIGSVITLPLLRYDMPVFELEVTNKFDFFPNLVSKEPTMSIYGQAVVDSLEILVSRKTLLEILNYYQVAYTPEMYIKLSEDISLEEGKEKLKSVFSDDPSVVVTSIDDRYAIIFEKEQFQLINSTLEGFLIIAILIVIIAFVYFSFLNIKDRQAEMGLYRVLGMQKIQYEKLFLIEGLFLICISSVVGFILGYIVSANFFAVITENSRGNIPPIRFIFNSSLFLNVILVLIVIASLTSILPARYLSRKQSGNLLRSV